MKICAAVRLLEGWEVRGGNRKRVEDAMNKNASLFRPDRIQRLSESKFKTFLSYAGNQHWRGIQRHPEIYCDMKKLRKSLEFLLDERRKIGCRLDELILRSSPYHIDGLREAVLTPILMCAYLDSNEYAVYNSISTAALKRLEGLGTVKSEGSLGDRYSRLNERCKELSRLTGKPLWLIDVMFAIMPK